MRDAKPHEQRFGEVQKRLQHDGEWLLLRAWCRLWKLPPNDPRVLDIPLSDIEDWLLANGLESWASEEEGRDLKKASYAEVFPSADDTFEKIYERVLERMGGAAQADPEEVLQETRRLWQKLQKEEQDARLP